MSIECLNHVWKNSQSKLGPRLVLLAIADYADEHHHAWPSMARLAQKSGLSERQVRRSLSVLTELGELTIAYNKGPHGVNLYQLMMTGGQIVRGDDMSPEGGHPVRERRPYCPPEPSVEPPKNHHNPLTPPNGSAEPNGHSLKRLTPRRRSAPKEYLPTPEFEAFIDEYPRRHKVKDACKAWHQIPDPKPVAQIMEAVQQQKRKVWNHCEKRYIPAPGVWLRGEQWDDEI